uniref:Uncharacterized protein n=1 Tax=Pseudoalteromonas luteoviolacea TaxID=43657 RepID=A0A023Q163_9GAMM|nr:hypothetical protein [Pseudoalteromonas luteoviolacea]
MILFLVVINSIFIVIWRRRQPQCLMPVQGAIHYASLK